MSFEVSALVDTGSNISCVRYESLIIMGDVTVSAERRKFIGIGEKEIETIGLFETEVCLDGIEVVIFWNMSIEADEEKFSIKSSKSQAVKVNTSSNESDEAGGADVEGVNDNNVSL